MKHRFMTELCNRTSDLTGDSPMGGLLRRSKAGQTSKKNINLDRSVPAIVDVGTDNITCWRFASDSPTNFELLGVLNRFGDSSVVRRSEVSVSPAGHQLPRAYPIFCCISCEREGPDALNRRSTYVASLMPCPCLP
ncbi:hypothetical protein HAX54_001406 [Datura stramonium]|uniref:Uncharacterized protein n=1 Tax=Datura stramonium TaxID=4076 RepID=A0ABS8T3B3_DATST|nr:hypothetical protein [Datura stramonium]